jgi:hypothetical protein
VVAEKIGRGLNGLVADDADDAETTRIEQQQENNA